MRMFKLVACALLYKIIRLQNYALLLVAHSHMEAPVCYRYAPVGLWAVPEESRINPFLSRNKASGRQYAMKTLPMAALCGTRSANFMDLSTKGS